MVVVVIVVIVIIMIVVLIVIVVVVVVIIVVLIVVVIVVSQYLQRFTCIRVATGLISFCSKEQMPSSLLPEVPQLPQITFLVWAERQTLIHKDKNTVPKKC